MAGGLKAVEWIDRTMLLCYKIPAGLTFERGRAMGFFDVIPYVGLAFVVLAMLSLLVYLLARWYEKHLFDKDVIGNADINSASLERSVKALKSLEVSRVVALLTGAAFLVLAAVAGLIWGGHAAGLVTLLVSLASVIFWGTFIFRFQFSRGSVLDATVIAVIVLAFAVWLAWWPALVVLGSASIISIALSAFITSLPE
jgi:hypothetical protein